MDENELSNRIIGAAIEVHKLLGPGLLESIYEEALATELQLQALSVVRQVEIEISYKGRPLGSKLRLDLLVNDLVVVEAKSTERILSVHEVQLLTYLHLSNKKLGLLINFNTTVLRNSIRRMVNNL